MNVQNFNLDNALQSALNPTDPVAFGLPGAMRTTPPAGDRLGSILGVFARQAGGGMSAAAPAAGGWQGIIQQLLGLFSQIFAALGLSSNGSPGGALGSGTQFQNATGSSTGDPHLAFAGTSNGQSTNWRFDSMTDHADLLDSDSFDGGFQISTVATQPNANGVSFNQRASVATQNGATQVSLDRNGVASITNNGAAVSIAKGQTLDLGGGETVTENADGSLRVDENDGFGSDISTTLQAKDGAGVDVSVTAQNVDLGGDLVNGPSLPPVQPPNVSPIGQHPPEGRRPAIW